MVTPIGTFRSGLEVTFAKLCYDNKVPYKYEETTCKFVEPEKKRSYKVDFDIGSVHIETKGRLTVEDRKKMLLVKQQHPNKVFIFVFSNKNKKLYKNSPTTYAQWAEKNGFIFYDIKDLIECPQKLVNLKSL